MKLRYLFSMILASALMFVSCVDEMGTDSFDNIKLDKTMLVIPVEGGSVELNIDATEAWAFDTLYTEDVWPNVIKRNTDKETGVVTVKSVDPSWLKVNTLVGEVGQTKVTFTADKVEGGRELELCIKAGVNSQFVKIRQGSLEASSATCAEVIAGADGKTYRVKGVCTAIANTTYGNWYLNDGTGEVYVYGTLDKDGKTKNYESWGMEVGDVVEVEGPKLTYGTTVELVDVTVLKIEKSLLKILTEEQNYAKEGGEFEVKVAFKGEGLYPTVDKDSKSWISLVGVKTYPGTPTKIEPNPADTAIVTFALSEFMEKAAPRKGALIFTSSNDDGSTEMTFNITQKGDIPDPTPVKDATKVGEGLYVEGTVVAINTKGYLLQDETGVIQIYHPESGWECPFEVGDKVGVAASALGAYNFSAQLSTKFGTDSANIYFEEKVGDKADVKYPDPVNYDATKIGAVIADLEANVDKADKEKKVAITIEYAVMVGKLSISGNYYNVEIAGTEYMGSLYNPLESLNLKDFDGKIVKLTGYFISVSQSSGEYKYANLVVTAVEEAGDVVFPELSLSKTEDEVAPEATEYTFDIKSNLDWTLTASEGVTLDKTSGNGNATVKMTFAANTSDAAIVHTVTAKAEGVADKVLKITQATAAAPTVATIAEFLAAAEDATVYQVTGVIASMKEINTQYHNVEVTIKDSEGRELLLYRMKAADGGPELTELGLSVGDELTAVGNRGSYKGAPQMINPVYVSHKDVIVATISEFIAAAEDDKLYELTGTISAIKDVNTQYNNVEVTIKDSEGTELLLYRMKAAADGKSLTDLGLKVGDVLTAVGNRGSYKGVAQMVNPIYRGHVEGAPAEDPIAETVLAEWLFSADAMAAYKDTFGTTDGTLDNTAGDGGMYVAANKAGEGKITFVQIDKTTLDAKSENAKRITGSTGHPTAYGVWPGDYWLFEATGKTSYSSGTKVNISYITRTSKTGMKYWRLEYLDGADWKAAMTTTKVTVNGEEIEYNIMMNADGSTNVKIDNTVTLSSSTEVVKFRMLCVANDQANGKGPIEKPNGGTCRIAGAEGTSPVIKVVE